MKWVYGTVTSVDRSGQVLGHITGDNGHIYAFRDSSFAPEAGRRAAVAVGDRVKFEDRRGWVFDLRIMDGGQR